jgi:hypothetical protein
MRLYPDVPRRRAATIAYDVLVGVLLAAFALIALAVHDAVDSLAVLGEGVREAGGSVPFGIGGPVEELGRSGEEGVHRLANILGAVTFALPATLALFHFLPRRVDQVRRLTTASQVLAGAPARELAMRAAFSLPYAQLLEWTDDPLGDVAAGRYERLAAAVLDDAGLRPSISRR